MIGQTYRSRLVRHGFKFDLDLIRLITQFVNDLECHFARETTLAIWARVVERDAVLEGRRFPVFLEKFIK
jgi:hypothetical protein